MNLIYMLKGKREVSSILRISNDSTGTPKKGVYKHPAALSKKFTNF